MKDEFKEVNKYTFINNIFLQNVFNNSSYTVPLPESYLTTQGVYEFLFKVEQNNDKCSVFW
jgi:hypothetical protein